MIMFIWTNQMSEIIKWRVFKIDMAGLGTLGGC
jgi:hypothetical protein